MQGQGSIFGTYPWEKTVQLINNNKPVMPYFILPVLNKNRRLEKGQQVKIGHF
jgi:hypothetical protein